MSRIDECFLAIRKNFSPEEFSDQEIRDMVKEFSEIQDAAGVSDFLERANEHRKNLELQATAQAKRKARTLIMGSDLRAKIADNINGPKERQIYQRAQNVFVGGAEISEAGNFSAQYIRAAYSRKMRGSVEMAIRAEGLEKEVGNSEFSRQLRMELMNHGSVNDPRIQRIAKTMAGVYEYQKQEFRRLDVDMGTIENYAGWQAYDKSKVLQMGKANWVERVLPLLDHKKTFKEEFTIDQKIKRLGEAYDSITSGDSVDPTKGRSLHYRDGDALHKALTEFGAFPSAVESLLAQIDYSSRRLALMNKFGPNYEDGYKNFKRWVEKTTQVTQETVSLKEGARGVQGAIDKAKELGTSVGELPFALNKMTLPLENLYLDIIGTQTKPTGGMLAKAATTYRTLVGLQNLGSAAISAFFPDFASSAALIKSIDGQHGIGSNLANIYKEYFKTIGNRAERGKTMHLMGIYADDLIGGISNVHGDLHDGAQPGIVSEMARAMYKWTGLTDHTQNIRAATAKVLGARMAEHSGRFNELPEIFKANLSRYGIGEKEWGVIHQATVTFPDGLTILAPQKIWELPGNLFDKKMTRGELYLKFSTAMNETTELATLTGDAYTRSLFYQGLQDDKIFGQIGRFMAQFKQAPVQNMRLMSRIANSDPDIVKRYGAVGKYFGDMASVVPAFTYMTMMGMMVYYAKELSSFKTPPDPTDPETLKQALIRGGGGGLMADYLFAEYNKSYRNIVEDIAGPAAGNASKLWRLYSATVRGEFKENKFEALKFAVRQIPGQNIWWAKGALEHVFLDSLQEYMSPGYTIKMDRRLEKKGQKRLLPSSDIFSKTPDRKVLIGGDE